MERLEVQCLLTPQGSKMVVVGGGRLRTFG